MAGKNSQPKLSIAFCLIWLLSVIGCGNSSKQNEAFAASIQGKWVGVGETLHLVIYKNHVEVSEGSRKPESFRYKLLPADKRIEITNPETGNVLRGIFTDQDTLEFEHIKKPGKILVLHRISE
jgi:hypothetical protein